MRKSYRIRILLDGKEDFKFRFASLFEILERITDFESEQQFIEAAERTIGREYKGKNVRVDIGYYKNKEGDVTSTIEPLYEDCRDVLDEQKIESLFREYKEDPEFVLDFIKDYDTEEAKGLRPDINAIYNNIKGKYIPSFDKLMTKLSGEMVQYRKYLCIKRYELLHPDKKIDYEPAMNFIDVDKLRERQILEAYAREMYRRGNFDEIAIHASLDDLDNIGFEEQIFDGRGPRLKEMKETK